MERTFIVTLSTETNEYALQTENFRKTLHNAFEWTGVVVSVTRYLPYTGKIGAIKTIRAALGCSLRDAKFLADTAQEKGTARWDNLTVTCTWGGENSFQVEWYGGARIRSRTRYRSRVRAFRRRWS